MDPDKEGKDHLPTPTDPKKSMIHRWCTSSDEVTSPESVTDLGSLPAFSSSMLSVRSPDLLLLKSPPSVSSLWQKSPKTSSELSSESPSVGQNPQDEVADEQDLVDAGGVVSEGSERLTEHQTTAVQSMTGSADDSHQQRSDVAVPTLNEQMEKVDDVCKIQETDNDNNSSLVCGDGGSLMTQSSVSHPPGQPSSSVSQHSAVLQAGGGKCKDSRVFSDATRRDSCPVSLPSLTDNQQGVAYVAGMRSLPEVAGFQYHSLPEQSQWDQFSAQMLSRHCASASVHQLPANRSAYSQGSTSPDEACFVPSAKLDSDKRSGDRDSGEQPAKLRRVFLHPARSASLGGGGNLSCEGEKAKEGSSDFVSLDQRMQGLLVDSALQLQSVTSSTHPPVQSSDKTFCMVQGDGTSLVPSIQGQSSGVTGPVTFEIHKSFPSQVFQSQSQLQPLERQSVLCCVTNCGQTSEIPIRSQEGGNPMRKLHLGGLVHMKPDGSTETSQDVAMMQSKHFQSQGLCKVSLTEIPSTSDDGRSSDAMTQEKTISITKDSTSSGDATSSDLKLDGSRTVSLPDVGDGLSQSKLHADSTKTDKQTCQVCGDLSASFHCGANVCEACKKFFVRCIRQEGGIKFICHRKQNCEVTKETRTQCQYCRFHKCLSLGMYKPGGSNISSEIGHIPCKVCSAPSSGYHFGAITCEGCKGFFRRTIKERDHMKYNCSKGGNCVVTMTTRNMCKYCRYQKCLAVGMTPTGSRIGRQPNSVRHATLMQLQQIKTMKGLPPDPHLPQPTGAAEVKQEPQDDEQVSEGDLCKDDVKKTDETLASEMASQSDRYLLLPEQAVIPGRSNNSADSVCDVGVKAHEVRFQQKHALTEEGTSSAVRTFVKDEPAQKYQRASDQLGDVLQNVQPSHTSQRSGCLTAEPQSFTARQSQPAADQIQMASHLTPSANLRLHMPSVMTCGEFPTEVTPSSSSSSSSLSSTSLPSSLALSSVPSSSSLSSSSASSVHSAADAKPLRQPDIIPPPSDMLTAPVTAPPPPPPPGGDFPQPTHISAPSADDVDSADHTNPSPDQSSHPTAASQEATNNVSLISEVNLAAATKEFIANAPDQLKKIRQRNCPRIEPGMMVVEIWNVMMSQFQHCAHATLKFAKMIPGFRRIPINRQIEAIRKNMFPIVIIQLSLDYDIAASRYNYFCLESSEEQTIMEHFPSFRYLIPSFHEIGQKVMKLNLSGVEASFLCGLKLAFDAKDGMIVENLTNSLQSYIKENNQSHCTNKFGKILLILSEFKKLTEVHQKCVVEVAADPKRYPGIVIPQLFQETFMEDA